MNSKTKNYFTFALIVKYITILFMTFQSFTGYISFYEWIVSVSLVAIAHDLNWIKTTKY